MGLNDRYDVHFPWPSNFSQVSPLRKTSYAHKNAYLLKDFIAAMVPNSGKKKLRVHLNILQPKRIAKKCRIYLVSGIQKSNQKGKRKDKNPSQTNIGGPDSKRPSGHIFSKTDASCLYTSNNAKCCILCVCVYEALYKLCHSSYVCEHTELCVDQPLFHIIHSKHAFH